MARPPYRAAPRRARPFARPGGSSRRRRPPTEAPSITSGLARRCSLLQNGRAGRAGVGTNQRGSARHRGLDGCQEPWHQRPEIGEPVCPRMKYNYGDGEGIQVLLKGKVSIRGNEHVEVFRGECQQRSVLDSRPAHLASRSDIVTDNVAAEAPVNAFVEEDLHEAASITRSLASSRKAMTCSRVTVGNPWRKSSIDSPASR